MIDVETVDAAATIRLLQTIEAMYPLLAVTFHRDFGGIPMELSVLDGRGAEP